MPPSPGCQLLHARCCHSEGRSYQAAPQQLLTSYACCRLSECCSALKESRAEAARRSRQAVGRQVRTSPSQLTRTSGFASAVRDGLGVTRPRAFLAQFARASSSFCKRQPDVYPNTNANPTRLHTNANAPQSSIHIDKAPRNARAAPAPVSPSRVILSTYSDGIS